MIIFIAFLQQFHTKRVSRTVRKVTGRQVRIAIEVMIAVTRDIWTGTPIWHTDIS
jgi:hypothetical protein